MSDERLTENTGAMSRRALLTGGLAVAAGAVMSAVAPQAASANVGDVVHVGDELYGQSTSFQSTSNGLSTGDLLTTSIIGRSTNSPPPIPVQALGGVVYAAAPAGSAGVWGTATGANQYGVHAVNGLDATSTALRAEAPIGTALQVVGKASFSRSGKATITKGHATRTVSVASGVSTGAMILVTLQGSAGDRVVLRYAKRLSASTFQVVLSKKATSTVTFAWMILG